METFIHAYSWVDLRFLLQGLWVTIYVSLISIALSFVVGLILGLIRYMKIKYVSAEKLRTKKRKLNARTPKKTLFISHVNST